MKAPRPTDFVDEVRAALAALMEQWQFRLVETAQSRSFDNAFVVLQSDDVRMRIVRDRSQVFVDFASSTEPETWFDLDILLRLLKSALPHVGALQAARNVADAAERIKKYYPEIRELFSASRFDENKVRLHALKRARTRERFGRDRDQGAT